MSEPTCGGVDPMPEDAQRTAVNLLWDIADVADPHLNRNLTALLTVASMPCVEARAVLREVLSAFEVMAEREPAVVMRLLGGLLNDLPPDAAAG
jgi:hypothetical protein